MHTLLLVLFSFSRLLRPPTSTLFPTRRSSDLDAADRIKRARTFDPSKAIGCAPRLLIVAMPENADGLQDRKSTRLNSSHRCISYAVFCLKKKKNENRQ